MANIFNPWVGYLDRNFINIKNRILNRMGETIPEMTDHSDSNILVVTIESFAGAAEMLSYYIDNMAREAFITTARKYSSVVKLTRLIDYRIKSKIPASADLTMYFLNNDGTPYNTPTAFTLPLGIIFTTDNGIEFISVKAVDVPIGANSATIPTRQKTAVTGDNIGITSDQVDQVYSLGVDYVYNSVQLTIGGEPWFLKDTLGRSKPTDKDYIVEVSASKEAYIRFGDGINGAIPTAGQNIVADYYTSMGSLGNVEVNTITNTDYDFSVFGIPDYRVTNINKASAGTDFEDIERIRRSAPLSLRTLERAVTDQDYIDLALLAPGVDKANMYFSCGKTVDLYIAPNNGGIASTGLLEDVELYFDDKKMVTTFVKAIATGESDLYFEMTVTGKFRKDGIQLKNELTSLLLDKYSYQNSDINKKIRTSDLIALVDNYQYVDYLQLDNIYVKPYMRPYQHNTQLDHTISINEGSKMSQVWTVQYTGYNYILLKGNLQIANLTSGEEFTDDNNTITVTFNDAGYTPGMTWNFTTLPVGKDIILNDYSIPVLKEENLKLNIIEQLSI